MRDSQSPSFSKKALLIKAPKSIDNSLNKFSSFFDDFHKFTKGQRDLGVPEKAVSFEVHLKENYFHYYIIAAPKLLTTIKPLLYTRFKDVEIIEKEIPELSAKAQKLSAEFGLKRYNFFPLKTKFSSNNDPYVILSAVLSKLDRFNESVVLQLVLQPMPDPWISQFLRERFYFILGTINSIRLFFEKPFLDREQVSYHKEIRNKFNSSHFLANLRVIAYAKKESDLKENFGLILKSLDKFNNGDVNSLEKAKISEEKLMLSFTNRQFSSTRMILNTQEAAAVFRFPDSELEISSVDQISSKKLEPPKNLSIGRLLEKRNISSFGTTNFRDNNLPFGIKREDRNRHLYIIGKTGMGKSKLIELLAISDIYQHKGLGVIDPHGDLSSNLLKYIPQERMEEVIYFNPADAEYPIGFNPLECHTPESKHQVVTGFVAIFKKLFAASWTNRLEHMLRFIVLALAEAGNATVVDIVRLLTETEFRQQIIAKLKDPVVKNFWIHEFAAWNERFNNEAIIPIINQVGQFIANDYVRNVVSQKKSAMDFYEAMNQGKIIIINIAKGKLGEDNTSLLGSMIITKIQEAIMARVSISEKERKPFYLYVDEFQNFATNAFNEILSEARKFNLSLTIAHQYLDQLSESIRKTVFGNVGSFICFRVGPEDAHYLGKEFAPQATPDDLINLDFRETYVKLAIDGKTSAPFSAKTITVPELEKDFSNEIIKATRRNFATPKNIIEAQFLKDKEITHLISEEKEEPEEEVFEKPIV